MDLDGFPPASVWYGGLAARLLEDVTVQEVFDRFARRVFEGISRKFVPVYRMADGEFEFVNGKIAPEPNGSPVEAVRHQARRLLRTFRFDTCWGESYSLSQRRRAITILRDSIRQIAGSGYVALYFMERTDGWSEEYFGPTCRWLERSGIRLTSSNYVPFYLVYALLSSRPELFLGQRMLVVTHLTPERQAAVERELRQRGARAVDFIHIPASGAIFTTLDLRGHGGRHDVAIVAAGIGSAAILSQLSPLSIPAIDAGMWIDCLVRPEKRRERPFLMPENAP